jgi:guanylate kinase
VTSPRNKRPAPGLLVVVSGPSGVGKTTVVERLLSSFEGRRAVTATTRAPRPGEVDGRDYIFLSEEEFRRRVAAGAFLEHAEVHGRLYGTPREGVREILSRGEVCVLSIDVQGAAQVRGKVEPALFVFLLPPDREELERRLRTRGTEAPEVVAGRLAVAVRELAREGEYDVSVVNDDLDRAVGELREIIERRLEETKPPAGAETPAEGNTRKGLRQS